MENRLAWVFGWFALFAFVFFITSHDVERFIELLIYIVLFYLLLALSFFAAAGSIVGYFLEYRHNKNKRRDCVGRSS